MMEEIQSLSLIFESIWATYGQRAQDAYDLFQKKVEQSRKVSIRRENTPATKEEIEKQIKEFNEFVPVDFSLMEKAIEPLKKDPSLQHSLQFEAKMRAIVQEFYSEHEVSKLRLIDTETNKTVIVDILVPEKIVFDVKSGKVGIEELRKLCKYAQVTGVKESALILSNNTKLSQKLRGFCKDNNIHIIYSDTLIEGLKTLETAKPHHFEQPFPPNHIARNNLNILQVIDLYAYYALPLPVEFDASPQKAKLWNHAIQIMTYWNMAMIQGVKASDALKLAVGKFGTSVTTMKSFIDFVLADMRKRGTVIN